MSTRSSNASPGPSSKRQRACSPQAGRLSLTRSEDWWYEDGNVLLQAEDTLFKVHKGIISKAEGLKSGLDVGRFNAADELFDGLLSAEEKLLPMLPMVQDRAKDVAIFLKAMYDGVTYAERSPTTLELRALLLLADKYHHPDIHSMAFHAYRRAVTLHRESWLDDHPLSSRRPPGFDRIPTAEFWDTESFPAFEDSVIALIAIAGEARLDVEDELSSLYSLLVEQHITGRAARISREFEVDGWKIGLDKRSLHEILSRIDRTSDYLEALRQGSASAGAHVSGCEASNQPCFNAVERLRNTFLDEDVFTATSSVRPSIEIALRFTSTPVIMNDPSIRASIRPECVTTLRQYWRDALQEYETSMAKGCDDDDTA